MRGINTLWTPCVLVIKGKLMLLKVVRNIKMVDFNLVFFLKKLLSFFCKICGNQNYEIR